MENQNLNTKEGSSEVKSAFRQLISLAGILGVLLVIFAIIGFVSEPVFDDTTNGNGTTTENGGEDEIEVSSGVRNCIGSVLDKAPSCSDCEGVRRKTKFLNDGTVKICTGLRSAGGDRCELSCE